VLLALSSASASAAPVYPPGFQSQTLVSGLNQPTAVSFAPDGRMFIAEKAGRLKVAQPGSSLATLVLDIGAHVNGYADRGLLDVAVDSDFADNGFVYLLYTYELNPLDPDSTAPMVSRLTRIELDPDGSLANPGAPETVLLGSYALGPCPQASNTLDCIPSDGASHSIGTVRSAPDGTLYVGSGDASDFNIADPLAFRTYDEQSLAGKITHVDRNGNGLPGHAFCPGDADLTHVCTKLYAKGFRNPFRFSLNPSGGLIVGDVGWNTWEEVDLIREAGHDYGWPCYEASSRTPNYRDLPGCDPEYAKEGTLAAALRPDHEYDHTEGSAIIGGPLYTGSSYPAIYQNSIFIGDFTGGFMKQLTLDAEGHVNGVEDFASDWQGVDLELHPSGDLVSVDLGSDKIDRIVYTGGVSAPEAHATANPSAGPAPLSVDFDGTGSIDADGDPLSYEWDFGDGATASGPKPTHVYAQTGAYTATLTVRDPAGRSDTDTVKIQPGANAPTVAIDAPTAGALYRDGDTVQLHGSASDVEDGALPASAFQWRVRLHHATHIHPISDIVGKDTSFVARRDHDADSSYDVTLTVTDSSGLTTTRTIEIRPQTVPLTLETQPAGAPVSYGGRDFLGPKTVTTTAGYDTTISAAQHFTVGSHTYVFDGWSDGGARAHDVRVSCPATPLRASYREDFAADHPATASSQQSADFTPPLAVDGNPLTRWASTNFALNPPWEPQSWQVDLGSEQPVGRVEIDWEAAYATDYTLSTSSEGSNFTQAAVEHRTGAGTAVITFASRAARYVRLDAQTPGTQFGISIWELRVLSEVVGTNVPIGQPAACEEPPVDSTPKAQTPPGNAEPPASDATPKPKDRVKPRLRLLGLAYARRAKPARSRFAIDFKLSERASVRLQLARRVHGKWRLLRDYRKPRVGPGKVHIALPRTPELVDGRYRVVLTATDAAGNRSTRLGKRFKVGPDR
jgi:glucose/arabinose dehydrogenase/chitodextrinase